MFLEEQHTKHKKKMSDSLLQIFFKNNFIPFFSFNPIFFSFAIYFKWFKMWWVHQLRLLKFSLYSKDEDAMIKNLKIEILIYFKLPIIEH
jgi:hypothetical protein